MDATDPTPEHAPHPDADPDAHPDSDAVASRAELLPEEREAGSDDPQAQAEAILADSQERTEDPEGTRDDSTQTPG
ncbi:hypothetical protein JOE61_001823 [Nocardioides salarius]|uniref:Uncharacterized protein n=1 Tax=Nocardioides salarius TaxID=374513 RepID=A0ABS2M9Y3_9ACTN|nr:hypothetical protein [Nocardioides salarius]MBM7508009.1 hypothetical protein [Nocardioides salarius]